MADIQKEWEAHEKEHAEELVKMEAEHAKRLAEQKAAFDEANAAQERAHAAAKKLRRERELEQIASHKRQFAERKAKFEKKHSNTWPDASTGISVIELNVENENRAEQLIKDLFYDYLIADVEYFNVPTLSRTWIKDNKERIWGNQNKLTMVTTDEKVPLVLAEVEKFRLREEDLVPFDFITYSVATGSKDYIQWVHDNVAYVRTAGGSQYQESGFTAKGNLFAEDSSYAN